MADLGLVWDPVAGAMDMAIVDNDLAGDEGLETAVLLALFCDARAADDDSQPDELDPNRRGWWGDQFQDFVIGSKLWLMNREKRTEANRQKIGQYSQEALAWMTGEDAAREVKIAATLLTNGWLVDIVILRPQAPKGFKYRLNWDAQLGGA